MKKISVKNLPKEGILTRDEMKQIEGGQTPPFRCELTNGQVVDCQTDTAFDCIKILTNGNQEVGGCWATTPLP